jgi:hypothetical protein
VLPEWLRGLEDCCDSWDWFLFRSFFVAKVATNVPNAVLKKVFGVALLLVAACWLLRVVGYRVECLTQFDRINVVDIDAAKRCFFGLYSARWIAILVYECSLKVQLAAT